MVNHDGLWYCTTLPLSKPQGPQLWRVDACRSLVVSIVWRFRCWLFRLTSSPQNRPTTQHTSMTIWSWKPFLFRPSFPVYCLMFCCGCVWSACCCWWLKLCVLHCFLRFQISLRPFIYIFVFFEQLSNEPARTEWPRDLVRRAQISSAIVCQSFISSG